MGLFVVFQVTALESDRTAKRLQVILCGVHRQVTLCKQRVGDATNVCRILLKSLQ